MASQIKFRNNDLLQGLQGSNRQVNSCTVHGSLSVFRKPAETLKGLPKVEKFHRNKKHPKQSESILCSHLQPICGSSQTNYGQKRHVLATAYIISGFQIFSTV